MNQNKKGKRVELAIANWMKENGVTSARRSQQFAGNAQFGSADIIANELPTFHIESKGTKERKLGRSVLKAWWNQLQNDCPVNKIPVLFHIANGCPVVGIIPAHVIQMIKLESYGIRALEGASITPIEHVAESEYIKLVLHKTYHSPPVMPFVVGYQIEEGKIFLFLSGLMLLEAMKKYEASIRVAS